jgi:ABC-type glycerol-3-phosphate transport system substrate-binding protein
MRTKAMFVATAVLLALAACSESKVDADAGTKVKIDIDSGDSKTATNVTVNADTDTGKFELKLPGGIDAKVNLPEGMDSLGGDHGKFDIDGVGLFPGAKVRSVNVNASAAKDSKSAVVKIGFTAPGDAAAVADWYQRQFDAKHKSVTRSGETLSGTTDDGDAFTIALEAAGAGASKGLLTIVDTKQS